MDPPSATGGSAATASPFNEYADTCIATATSSQGASRNPPPRHDSGAKPIAWTTPSRSVGSRLASASRSAGSVTSSCTISGVVGSLRAVRSVRRMIRPNDDSTTSAPCSCATRATPYAIDWSLSPPVTRTRLPASSISGSRVGDEDERGVVPAEPERVGEHRRPLDRAGCAVDNVDRRDVVTDPLEVRDRWHESLTPRVEGDDRLDGAGRP